VRKSHIPICYVVWNAGIMKLKTDISACSLVYDNDRVSIEIGEEIKFSAECYGLSSCAHDAKENLFVWNGWKAMNINAGFE
jgi:hypothetical protein